MTFSMVIFIALAVYLVSKAVTYERSIAVDTEEENLAETIEEIHEKVCQLFSLNKYSNMGSGMEVLQ